MWDLSLKIVLEVFHFLIIYKLIAILPYLIQTWKFRVWLLECYTWFMCIEIGLILGSRATSTLGNSIILYNIQFVWWRLTLSSSDLTFRRQCYLIILSTLHNKITQTTNLILLKLPIWRSWALLIYSRWAHIVLMLVGLIIYILSPRWPIWGHRPLYIGVVILFETATFIVVLFSTLKWILYLIVLILVLWMEIGRILEIIVLIFLIGVWKTFFYR